VILALAPFLVVDRAADGLTRAGFDAFFCPVRATTEADRAGFGSLPAVGVAGAADRCGAAFCDFVPLDVEPFDPGFFSFAMNSVPPHDFAAFDVLVTAQLLPPSGEAPESFQVLRQMRIIIVYAALRKSGRREGHASAGAAASWRMRSTPLSDPRFSTLSGEAKVREKRMGATPRLRYSEPMQRRAEVALVAASVTAVALTLLATQPRDAFWGPDSGNRFIQLRSLLRTGRLAIDDAPRAAHHFVQVGSHVYSFYSPAFALASAPLYAALGTWGLFILPILGTVAIALLLSPLLERDYLPLAAAAIFATPLIWYTVVFWEQTLAAALALGAYVLVTREHYLAGGCVAAAGAVFREEGYVMIAAVIGALLLTRRTGVGRFVAGAMIVIAPLWVANALVYGHPLGLHARVYVGMGGPRLSNWSVYLFEFTRWPRVTRDTLFTQGFFPTVPLAFAVLLSGQRDRFLLATIACGVLLTPLLLNQSDFGLIWGSRHFLWLVPLVAVAAAPALRRSRSAAVVTAILIVAGLALQAQGIRLLRNKLQFSEQLLRAASAPGKPIVTDVFWIPEDLAALYGRREVRLVDSDAEIPHPPLVFVGARANRVVSARPLAGRIISRKHIAVGTDAMLDAIVLDCQ
jgi:hypothetical protein